MRLKIALRNLYISQAVILIFLIFAYFFWFPHSFSELGGFYKTASMLVLVDLVLGPALVFFIYKENKKHLQFDINVLLSIQLIAFIFGAYSLFLKHPAYVVFSVDRFVLTNVSKIHPQPSGSDKLKRYFFSRPKFVIANFPQNSNERNQLNTDIIFNREPDIDSRPKYFTPFDQKIESLMNKSIQLKELASDTLVKQKLKELIKVHGGKMRDYVLFPLRGNNSKDMVWVFDKNSGKPVEILDIDPWKFKIASNQKEK